MIPFLPALEVVLAEFAIGGSALSHLLLCLCVCVCV